MKKLLILLIFTSSIYSQSENKISITYVANSGFLFSGGGKCILIDALFNQSFGQYDPPSDSLIKRIVEKDAPFSAIDLYLITHNHGDHFYAPYVKDYLKHHDETILVSSSEVCSKLVNTLETERQVTNVSLNVGESIDTVVNGIPLKIFRLIHYLDSTGTHVANYAFLISLNGVKIFHPGDMTVEWDKSLLEKIDLGKEHIDIMLLQNFDRSDFTKKYIKEIVKPKYIVAIHIPPSELEERAKYFHDVFPDGIVFMKPLDTKVFK